ncbi:M10 family metallopeptidase C-terminal domain-containing protein, partial [Roseicyclus mahoneyensis]
MTCSLINPFGGNWLHNGVSDRTFDESSVPGGDVPNGPNTLVALEPGDTFTGSLGVAEDWDWFYFEYQAGVTYTITMTPGTLDDPLIWLADENGNLLESIDNGFSGAAESVTFTAPSSGVGFIVADSYYNTLAPGAPGYGSDTGTYTITVTSGSAPPPPPPSSSPLDAITWNFVAPRVIDVYFAPGGLSFSDEFGTSATTGAWNAFELQQAMLAFELFENVANVTFNIVTNPNQAEFFMVEVPGNNPLGYWGVGGATVTLAGTTYSNLSGHGVFFNNADGWDTAGLAQGGFGFVTLIHEIGHGMGLAHPHDTGGGSTIMPGVFDPFADTGTSGLNQGIYTTMSYIDGWVAAPHGLTPSLNYGYQGALMAFDIAVLQDRYGANMSFNTGNETYVLPTTNGPGTFYAAIWDAGGVDAIVHNGSAAAVIDLRPASLTYAEGGGGYVSYVQGIHGGFTIANGVVIENATGGSGNDTITGNDANNVLIGGAGFDS